jgi:hypothetical protein
MPAELLPQLSRTVFLALLFGQVGHGPESSTPHRRTRRQPISDYRYRRMSPASVPCTSTWSGPKILVS